MQNITSITINSVNYFSADELKDFCPASFIGARTTREYIKKRKVPNDQYIFARHVSGEWQQSDGKSNRVDKVFLRQDHVEANIAPPKEANEASSPEKAGNGQYSNYILSGEEHTTPIVLESHEKFRDDDGTVYKVDVRGQRHEDKCYFRVRDIEKVFGMDNLSKTLSKPNNNYEKCEDYVLLCLPVDEDRVGTRQHIKSIKTRNIKFLTYSGLMRVIYVSRNKTARKFAKWATKMIYTAHMGTKPQRQKVAAKIGKVDIRSFRAVTNTMSRSLPGIYLIRIGTIDDFRAEYEISPEYSGNLYKFGYSEDITRRMKEHTKRYGPNIEMTYLAQVDPIFLARAETKVKKHLADIGAMIDAKDNKELCALSPVAEKRMKEVFDEVKEMYSGHYSEMRLSYEKALAERDNYYNEKINSLLCQKEEQAANERAELMRIIQEERRMLEDERGRVTKLMDKLLSKEA